jgi:hypothetical protein
VTDLTPRFIPIKFRNGRWRAELVADYKLVNQLRDEAGLKNAPWPDPPDAYDRILEAAGNRDFGLETEPPHFSGEPNPPDDRPEDKSDTPQDQP